MKKRYLLTLMLGVMMITSCNGFMFGNNSSNSNTSSTESTSSLTSKNDDNSNTSTKNDTNSSVSSNTQGGSSNTVSFVEEPDEYRRLEIKGTIQDLPYVEGALPSKGNPKALVIPVEFPDCTAKSKGYTIDLIEKAFNGKSEDMEWESVNSYYKKSSYGKLDIEFDVRDSWFTTKNQSSYYERYTDPEGYIDAAELIIKEYLKANPDNLDFSDYDTNGDDYIDGIYLIYTHDVNYDSDDSIWWAYQYWYMSDDFYDGVTPYYYMFAGYEFMFEDDMECNTHTYIHESGHMLGLEDYYDYYDNQGTSNGGLAGADMMDYTVGDQNPFSKLLLGWGNPILIETNDSVTINLKAFQENGDFIILSDKWDDKKGMYQEYFIVEYWTPTGLNEYDSKTDYLYSENGIRVIQVNATLETKGSGEQAYEYFKLDNSTTNKKLISLIPANNARINANSIANNSYLYSDDKYSTLGTVKYHGGTALKYTFKVNSLNETYANLTFTKL